MRRVWSICVGLLVVLTLQAEEYTIVFNSSTSDASQATDKLESIVLISSDNCVDAVLTANKIYRAKEGFGIKGGTTSVGGRLTLGLNTEYTITAMTVYAAAYSGKPDSVTSIRVCGEEIAWQTGKATQIMPYVISAPGKTDSIQIEATKEKNNRFYIQKIVFTAADPMPNVAKITVQPQVDFGTAVVVDGNPATDAQDVSIIARGTNWENLQLSLWKGTYFSLGTNVLSNNGGEVTVSYTITSATDKGFPVNDSLIIKAKGRDGKTVRRSILLKLYAKNCTSPILPVDSSCMRIGKMPANYYQPAQGLKDSALKSALGEVIHCGPRYRYGSGRLHTWHGFFFTDRDTMTQQVLDMYSDNVRYFNIMDTCESVAEFDIEHMLPKSWWGGDVNEAYCDLYHLVPADYSANRSKSNHAPGIPSDSTFNNGSFVTGSGSAYGLTRVFCPADEYKGDFARAYFYIVTCYEELKWEENGEAAVAMTNESYLDFRPWLRDLLVSWHRQDPVSEKEKARAKAVNKIQGNRNPFIDYPDLVEYIWGNKRGQAVNFYSLVQSFGDKYSELVTSLSDIHQSMVGNKQIKDGQLVIIQNGKEYTLEGKQYQ